MVTFGLLHKQKQFTTEKELPIQTSMELPGQHQTPVKTVCKLLSVPMEIFGVLMVLMNFGGETWSPMTTIKELNGSEMEPWV